jgi:hypothetical protein
VNYDFDMHSIIPDAVQRKNQGFFNELGVSALMSRQIALWRDPQVVEALRRADEPVRQLFLKSGFGVNRYDSGAPAGRYPARDENARLHCLQRLTDNWIEALEGDELDGADWGGFDIAAFLISVAEAEPIDEVEIDAFAAKLRGQARQREQLALRRKIVQYVLLGLGITLVAVAGMLAVA